MKIRSWLAVAALSGLIHGAAGCTLLAPSRAELPRLHALEWSGATPATPVPADAPTLLVGIPRAGAGYDSPRMAYASEPHALAYFARHQWVDTPARMLQPLLARAAEGTGRFEAVVQAPTSVAASLRLDTEIVQLVQDFSVRPSVVRVVLRVQLVELDARRVVATREVKASSPTASDDPLAGVDAANRALAEVLDGVARLCASGVEP